MMPAPAVQAYCYVPHIKLGTTIDFMIDTGAAGTCIHGSYAYGLREYMRPETLTPIEGIGGSHQYFKERAIIVFTDTRGNPIPQVITLCIQRITNRDLVEHKDLLRMPCLLGRDILNRWEFKYDARKENITLEVPSS